MDLPLEVELAGLDATAKRRPLTRTEEARMAELERIVRAPFFDQLEGNKA